MSTDIFLIDPNTKNIILFDNTISNKNRKIINVEYRNFCKRQAWINITCNYFFWYHMDGVFPITKDGERGIRSIYGMTGYESIPIIKKAISLLEKSKEDIRKDERIACTEMGITGYWIPTKENAIKPLYELLALAEMRPDGIWSGY